MSTTGQIWATSSAGGYLYSDELSDYLRVALQPLTKFRQFCDAQDATEKGLRAGEAWHWDIIGDVATQGTTLTETSTMPETSFTITQGTLTITVAGNSVPYTGKLDNLSKFPVQQIINRALKNDAKKALDQLSYNQFNLTPLRVVATTATDAVTLTTNGTATATNTIALGKNHVKPIVDTMKERNIPWIGGLAA